MTTARKLELRAANRALLVAAARERKDWGRLQAHAEMRQWQRQVSRKLMRRNLLLVGGELVLVLAVVGTLAALVAGVGW